MSAPQSPNFAKGKLTKVTSSVSETRNTVFDNLGRLKESQQITDSQTYTSKYTYNLSGALVEEEYPSGRKVKNEFESDGDLLKVSSQKNVTSAFAPYVSNFSYTASGGISQMRLGNGKWETAKFNTRLQVTELGLGNSATDASVWKTAYEYGELDTNGNVDAAKNTGNIARQTLTVPGTSFVLSYKYDSLYRLTEAKETTGANQNWIQNWNYDRYGNRIGFTQNIAGLTNAPNPTIDANTNRFVTASTNFQYDLNGNLVRDTEGRQFTFNGDNKQTVVKDASNNPIGQYFYDGEGKRVKKVTNSETTIFVYSAGKLIAEYSTQLSQTPTIAYTTTDHLGSPRIITDALGQVKSRRDFLPFGEDLYAGVGPRTENLEYGSNQDDIKQKFTGYLKDDETGLDFAEARMYENRHGRFTAVDPLLASGKSTNPQTFNRYAYTSNNPVIRVDVDGKRWRIAFEKIEGRWYVTPYWNADRFHGGRKWGTSGSGRFDDGRRYTYETTFAYQDSATGTFSALDFYENRPVVTGLSSMSQANDQIAAWNRQAAINFAAGFAAGASLAVEMSGAGGIVGETGTQMYAMGQRAGTGASIASAITGVGLTNAVLNQFGKAGLKVLRGIEFSAKGGEGVYDLGTTLGKYVGQSQDIMKRVDFHFASGGKLSEGELSTAVFYSMPGSTKKQREAYEHYLITEKYGIDNLINVRRPMGGRREEYNRIIDDVIKQFNLPR